MRRAIHMLDGQPFSNENKGKLVMFLQDFCKGNEKHSSGFTGGQILLLVLRACNDGDREDVKIQPLWIEIHRLRESMEC